MGPSLHVARHRVEGKEERENGDPLPIKVDWPTLARKKAERSQNLILDKGDESIIGECLNNGRL